MDDYLQMRGIVKRFPGVFALDHVHLAVRRGEVHALLGENGAGKSTLMKILSGAYSMDEGEILIDGKPAAVHSSHDAQALGISIIYQELNLVEELSVAENIFLGRPFMINGRIDWRQMYAQAQQLLDSLHVPIQARARVASLGVAHKQMVELAKALSIQSRVLILDEPTAPLTRREIDILFEVIRMLRERGCAIIYISHRLEEVMEVCDRATIMRDGKNICVLEVANTNLDEIIRYMVGRELKEKFPKIHVPLGRELLRVEALTAGKQVQNISFSVREGEILGIAGLVGSGRTETVRALFGADPKQGGVLYIEGKEQKINCPLDAIRCGIGFATEDRKMEGLVLTMSMGLNITLSALPRFGRLLKINLKQEKAAIAEYIQRLRIKTPSMMQRALNLSGGNQQKVVLAKWLLSRSRILILDEPTRGIDVGAKIEVYHIINELVQQGAAIIMISSEMPEILSMADRVLVMWQGKATGVFDNDGTLTQEKILTYATGGERQSA